MNFKSVWRVPLMCPMLVRSDSDAIRNLSSQRYSVCFPRDEISGLTSRFNLAEFTTFASRLKSVRLLESLRVIFSSVSITALKHGRRRNGTSLPNTDVALVSMPGHRRLTIRFDVSPRPAGLVCCAARDTDRCLAGLRADRAFASCCDA